MNATFKKFIQGYEDGYSGTELRFPEDDDYIIGYHTGSEDDQEGRPNKFEEDEPHAD